MLYKLISLISLILIILVFLIIYQENNYYKKLDKEISKVPKSSFDDLNKKNVLEINKLPKKQMKLQKK